VTKTNQFPKPKLHVFIVLVLYSDRVLKLFELIYIKLLKTSCRNTLHFQCDIKNKPISKKPKHCIYQYWFIARGANVLGKFLNY
jgi:hypothetical protein